MPVTRLARLGDFAFRRRRLVLAAWIGALVAAFALSAAFGGAWSGGLRHARLRVQGAPPTALEQRFPASSPDTVDVVWSNRRTGAAAQQRTSCAAGRRQLPKGLGRRGAGRRSRPTGTIAVARLPLDDTAATACRSRPARDCSRSAEAAGRTGCTSSWAARSSPGAQQGPLSSEAVGLLIAALVLLIALRLDRRRGAAACTALFGLGICGRLIGVLAALLGAGLRTAVAGHARIGVGIDYALLILTRSAPRWPRAGATPSPRRSPRPGAAC